MSDLTIHTELAQRILSGFIRSEISRVGYSRAVIGLSGGINSALSCYLAVEALGPQKMCWLCACPTALLRIDSLEHAQLVIEATGYRLADHPHHRNGRATVRAIPGDESDAARQRDGTGAHDRHL